jgi:hypothetical protein
MKYLLTLVLTAALITASCKSKKQVAVSTTPVPAPPPIQPSKPDLNDMRVVLHEETLNKMFVALGTITGKEPYRILLMNDTCVWKLINPRINLHPGKADFITFVNVKAGPFDYTSQVKGNVFITYDRVKNMINVQIQSAIVELYTKILGNKIHIKNIDIADRFAEPFSFEGPTASESELEFTMPDNTVKKLIMRTTDCDLQVAEKMIIVPCETEFLVKP